MSRKRRYQLLCPVARALDVVGDRWSLLILRDLHAGPARFQQLQEGLGLASNLLTIRLNELTESGLIQRPDGARQSAYALTDLGRRTDRVLWELVRFGSLVDRDPDPRQPGSLRTIALPLRMMLSAVDERPTMTVRLLVNDDTLTVHLNPDDVDVVHSSAVEESTEDREPDLIIRTGYESFLDLAEGHISLDDFGAAHRHVIKGEERLGEFATVMAIALHKTEHGLV